MNHEQKKQIKDALVRYAAHYTNADAVANSMDGVSATTVAMVTNYNWDMVSEAQWGMLARQVGFYCGDWKYAETTASLLLRVLLNDAQNYAMVYGVAMAAGTGKTFCTTQYARTNNNVVYITGRSTYNRKTFIAALLQVCDYTDIPESTPDRLKMAATLIAAKTQPLIIIDEAHLLKDRVLHLIVLLAEYLNGQAGLILMGDSSLRTRIVEGVRLKKPGFDDIYKMTGRRFVTLGNAAPADVQAVCRANAVNDEDTIAYITTESNGNLHIATSLITQIVRTGIAA